MKKRERQEFIKKEIEAIYCEFEIYLEQLNLLKTFIKDLIDVANGAEPTYDLSGITQKGE